MNNKKRYNRPFQLQVNVSRTMAILRYESFKNRLEAHILKIFGGGGKPPPAYTAPTL